MWASPPHSCLCRGSGFDSRGAHDTTESIFVECVRNMLCSRWDGIQGSGRSQLAVALPTLGPMSPNFLSQKYPNSLCGPSHASKFQAAIICNIHLCLAILVFKTIKFELKIFTTTFSVLVAQYYRNSSKSGPWSPKRCLNIPEIFLISNQVYFRLNDWLTCYGCYSY